MATQGKLDETQIEWDARVALGVVLAANGYPNDYKKGGKIIVPSDSEDAKIFHAGTKLDSNNIVSNGGRVLCATALGNSIQEAQKRAYELVDRVDWHGSYYRTDIGFKAL